MKLRAAAEESGWGDYKDVAEHFGWDRTTTNRYFNGKREPGGIATCHMMLLFGIGPADLLGQTAPERQQKGPGARVDALETQVRELQAQMRRLILGLPVASEAEQAEARASVRASDRERHLAEEARRAADTDATREQKDA